MNRVTAIPWVCLSLCLLAVGLVLAGPLDPPAGPVASTHKTLTEVEPRIAISAANTPGDVDSLFKITQPGSYYLTGNITGVSGKHGVKIDGDGVTLDLNGFELVGAAGTLDGVRVVPGRRSVTVRNGSLRAWRGAGLSAVGGPNADACLYVDLRAVGNGTNENSYAIDVGGASNVVNCTAAFNLGTGFRGNNGTNIQGCSASGNGGDGIICGAGAIRDCLARGNAYDGLRGGAATVITGCSSTANLGAGITINFGSSARGNACLGNGWGIYIYGDGSTVDGNTLSDNAIGVEASDPGNFIYRNTLSGNATLTSIVAGNDVGPMGSAATSTSPWANLVQ